MKRSMLTGIPTLACLAAAAACSGSLSGSTDKPSVLATIHGTVDGSPSMSLGSSQLAVAIVWGKFLPGSVQAVSTSVAVRPAFPSSFSLDLTDLPPDSALFDVGDANINCLVPPCDKPDAPPLHQRIALGFLVVYEDLNHNGQLDLVAPGAPAYVDKVVGLSGRYFIVYTEQPIPENQNSFPIPGTDGSLLKPGYNWVGEHRWDCEPGQNVCGSSVLYRPIDAPVVVPISDDPGQEEGEDIFMCTVIPSNAGGGGLDTGPSSPLVPESPAEFGGPLPSTDDPELLCDNQTSFRYFENCTSTTTTAGPGVCRDSTTMTACTKGVVVTLPAGMEAPPGWPCVPQRSF